MRTDAEARREYAREYYARRVAADPTYRARYAASALARLRRMGVKPAVRRTREEKRRLAAARAGRWWREDAKDMSFVKKAITNARLRARKKGIPFSLTAADIELPEVCPVLGTPFGRGRRAGRTNLSLDRVIPARGYVPGNVRVISWRANSLKSDATLDEMRRVVAYMEREEDRLEVG